MISLTTHGWPINNMLIIKNCFILGSFRLCCLKIILDKDKDCSYSDCRYNVGQNDR